MFKLGKYRQNTGGVGAGADNEKLWRVFQAEDKPILITALSWYGGDASEYYHFAQVPPGTSLEGSPDGTQLLSDCEGAITVMTGNIEGNIGTQDEPYSFYGNWQRSAGPYVILPPYYTLVVYPAGAASAAAFTVWIGGFEIDA